MAGDRKTGWIKLGWDGREEGDGLPPGEFGVIYADCPWGWIAWDDKHKIPHRGGASPYDPMTRAELLALPVGRLAKKNSLLVMWVVSSHLEQAHELAAAWGFTFRTLGFVWIKLDQSGRPKMGMGRWTRQEAEICLIFGKGRPPRLSGGVRQVLMERAREHSRKPDEFADRIRELVGGPYLELFSRTPRFFWTTWGDQLDKFSGGARGQATAKTPATDE